MSSNFETQYLMEPDLMFGRQGEDKDPRIGLKYHGPYFYPSEGAPLESVRIGIIGNRECTAIVEKILGFIQKKVPSPKPNRWLFFDYPGMNEGDPFKCDIKTSKNWNASLSDDYELKKIENIENANERIAYAVNLYVDKVEQITKNDDLPNVIICALPKIVELYCGISKYTRGAKSVRASPLERKISEFKKNDQKFLTDWNFEPIEVTQTTDKSFDFRNSLKGKVMKFGIPTQILRETTCKHMLNYNEIEKKTKEDPASFSWNLSTALYYKANGKPWRLAKLRQDTCYVGISFFIDKLNPDKNIQISMAQVFTHNGEGLVLRGTEVEVNEYTKQAYLKKDQAMTLMKRALQRYRDKAQRNPSRVVIHKSSTFSEDEKAGFNEAIYESGKVDKDFVTIRSTYSWIQFMRLGQFPVLRGTMIDIHENEFLLYTSGYSPRLRTYAGHSIPNPLRVIHLGDSSRKEVAEEILGLTKLNWNTTAFSTSMPITLRFAGEVGRILSELPDDKVLQDHYRFFM